LWQLFFAEVLSTEPKSPSEGNDQQHLLVPDASFELFSEDTSGIAHCGFNIVSAVSRFRT